MHPKARDLQARLLKYSTSVARICDTLPSALSASRIAGQLVDSSSSSYGNYRSACRARSRAEFIAKLGVVVEELDESEGWLILLQELTHIGPTVATPLLQETNELLSIFTAFPISLARAGQMTPAVDRDGLAGDPARLR